MKSLMDMIERVLDTNSTIFIVGETGTGKNHLAEAIHKAGHLTKDGPFVLVNCGALSEHESALLTEPVSSKFNPIRQAKHGTLFLDEIQDTPLEHQKRLIRLLQGATDWSTEKIDMRIVASSSVDLAKAVDNGSFRKDLYYRLNVFELTLPLLKDRKEDIMPLTDTFTSKFQIYNERLRNKVFSSDAQLILLKYDWPGNVRELRNVVESALLISDGDIVTERDLPKALSFSKTANSILMKDWEILSQNSELSLKKAVKKLEYTCIKLALERTNGNRTRAAIILEISRPVLIQKIKDYDL
jgi:two-component system, NtrC family, response regulator AtoC